MDLHARRFPIERLQTWNAKEDSNNNNDYTIPAAYGCRNGNPSCKQTLCTTVVKSRNVLEHSIHI